MSTDTYMGSFDPMALPASKAPDVTRVDPPEPPEVAATKAREAEVKKTPVMAKPRRSFAQVLAEREAALARGEEWRL